MFCMKRGPTVQWYIWLQFPVWSAALSVYSVQMILQFDGTNLRSNICNFIIMPNSSCREFYASILNKFCYYESVCCCYWNEIKFNFLILTGHVSSIHLPLTYAITWFNQCHSNRAIFCYLFRGSRRILGAGVIHNWFQAAVIDSPIYSIGWTSTCNGKLFQ